MLLSIIIPVFNEVTSVVEVVDRVLQVKLPEGMGREIIVVDDGSTDGTSYLLKLYAEHPDVHVHFSVLNFGKGVAVRVGLRYAQGDIVVIQDADLEYDPSQLAELLVPILEGRTRVVFGSRYLGQARGMVLLQDLGNRILTGFTNLLFGSRLTDSYTCYKILDRESAAYLSRTLQCRGFELEAEMTARLLRRGEAIMELPIDYQARSRSQGKKIRPRDGLLGLYWLLQLRLCPALS